MKEFGISLRCVVTLVICGAVKGSRVVETQGSRRIFISNGARQWFWGKGGSLHQKDMRL